jgi:alkyl hydroperoxide reductase subunit AhpC
MKRLSTQFIFVVKIFCLISSQAQFLNGCFSEYFNQTNNSANFKEINVMINETLQLECSLESQIDHVIWKRKMNDDIQILTINEYNFISMS